MSFATLIGNQRNRDILQRLLRRGNLGSTFIFAGPDGVGKRQFALTTAKAANCIINSQDEGFAGDCCDECSVCRRIDGGVYGDVSVTVPDGQFIKIAQARAIADEVFYRPREGRRRFFIIDDADRLREQAANALLKTLEEPPATSTMILITSRPDSLLTTIRSRAQMLRFTTLSIPEMETYLKENFPRPSPDTLLLSRITEGRIGQATAFDLSVYRQQRRALIGLLEVMAEGEDRLRLLKAAEYLGKKERSDFEKDLDLLASLLRDLFLLSAGMPKDAIINIDVTEKLESLASKITTDRLIEWSAGFDKLRSGLRVNINRQLATEATLLELA